MHVVQHISSAVSRTLLQHSFKVASHPDLQRLHGGQEHVLPCCLENVYVLLWHDKHACSACVKANNVEKANLEIQCKNHAATLMQQPMALAEDDMHVVIASRQGAVQLIHGNQFWSCRA